MNREKELAEQYDKIYRYCFFKLGQRELAEDITQETFLRFLNHEKYRHIDRQLPLLYTIARNLCVDEFRKKKTESLLSEPEDKEAEERMFTAISVKMALRELEEEERDLLLLRYVNEVPVSALCKMFQVSRYALYRKLKKAEKKLEEKLQEGEM
ncbi:MAG: RNA polymerase sigma factor [Lachnospiraceae bacterium]|nr:RNA polymerase sigma factor [Lachnospiraceae bacterium]